MKLRFQKSARLGDTEIILSFYGPVGGSKNGLFVDAELGKIAAEAVRKIKKLTDGLQVAEKK